MFSSFLAERHPKRPQELACLVVVVRAGHKRDIHTLGEGDFVRINFRKNHLLGEAETVISLAIKALGIDPSEIADTRQGDTDQAVEKLVHSPAAQSYPAADLISFT